MAKRMTVAGLAKIVAELSERFDRRFDSVERHFDAVDRRFEDVDRRFEDVDRRFDELGGQMRAIGEAISLDPYNADQFAVLAKVRMAQK